MVIANDGFNHKGPMKSGTVAEVMLARAIVSDAAQRMAGGESVDRVTDLLEFVSNDSIPAGVLVEVLNEYMTEFWKIIEGSKLEEHEKAEIFRSLRELPERLNR